MSFQVIITILIAAGSLAYFVPTPQELREAFVAGQNYFAARNYTKAIEQYDKVLMTESDLLTSDSVRVTLLNGELNVGVRSAAIYQKANAYRTMGSTDSAIATFRQVLTRFDSPTLLVLSQYQIYDLFLQKKEYDSAITEARALIQSYPFDEKVEQAYYDIGWAFRFKFQYDSSSVAFQHIADAYKESPYRVRAMYQIGQNAFDAQEWRGSLTAFSVLVNQYKPESFTRTDFQNMELRANRERQIFEAASNRESDNTNLELVSKAEFKIAEAYEHLNEIDSAVARYQYIIRTYTLLPSLIEISYIRWAELILKVKGLNDAIAVYRRAIDENFQDKIFQARMQYKIARTLQDEKNFERSAYEYDFYVKAYSEYADQADFSTENARFFSVLNYNAAKKYEFVVAASDSFLANHAGSEFSAKALIIRGNSFQHLRRFDQARECYMQVLDQFGATGEATHARMQMAKSYYEEKNYETAIRQFEELLNTISDSKDDSHENELNEVRYFLGMSLFFTQKNDAAISLLQQVKSNSSFYPFAFARIVKIYSAQSKFEEAERYISGILAELPDTSEFKPYARLAHGELLAATGKFDQAIDEMSKVLKDSLINENARLQARYARGALYQQTKRNKEAIDDLEFCLKQEAFRKNFSATIPTANEKLALAYLGIGKRKEAVEKITALVDQAQTQSDKIRYLSALTELYAQLAEYQRVVEFGLRVVQADSADENSKAKAYAALANAYGNLNTLDKVVDILSHAMKTLPLHSYVKTISWEMAMLFYDGQAFQYAEKLFARYIETYTDDPKNEDALDYRATSLIHIGKLDEGIALKRTFISKYPYSSKAAQMQYEIAETMYGAERFDMAIREYERTAREYPSSEYATTALYNKGWCFYRLGDTLKMVESFERFVKTHPNSQQAPDAHFSIGDYYYNIKEHEKAKQAYQVIADTYPIYSRYEEAKSLVRELNQINSFQEYARAMLAFDSQNYKIAIPMLEEVIKKYPDADIRYACEANIASAYSELGDKKKALDLFNKIIRNYSDIPEAQMVLFFSEQHKRWIESGKNQ